MCTSAHDCFDRCSGIQFCFLFLSYSFSRVDTSDRFAWKLFFVRMSLFTTSVMHNGTVTVVFNTVTWLHIFSSVEGTLEKFATFLDCCFMSCLDPEEESSHG